MTLTEPQVWVLIGTFATVMVGLLGLTLNLTTRTFKAELGRVEGVLSEKMTSLEHNLGMRIDGLDRRMDSLDRRIDNLEHRVDGLDRDVAAITRHLLGDEE